MLLLDTSFLIEFEDEVARRRPGVATALLAAHRRVATAISIITLGEFAEGFTDAGAFGAFIARFRVVQLSRGIAWRAAMIQSSLSRRLGENDAWIAATRPRGRMRTTPLHLQTPQEFQTAPLGDAGTPRYGYLFSTTARTGSVS